MTDTHVSILKKPNCNKAMVFILLYLFLKILKYKSIYIKRYVIQCYSLIHLHTSSYTLYIIFRSSNTHLFLLEIDSSHLCHTFHTFAVIYIVIRKKCNLTLLGFYLFFLTKKMYYVFNWKRFGCFYRGSRWVLACGTLG